MAPHLIITSSRVIIGNVGWSADPDSYMDSLGYRYVTYNLTEYNIFLILYYYLLIIIKNKIINL